MDEHRDWGALPRQQEKAPPANLGKTKHADIQKAMGKDNITASGWHINFILSSRQYLFLFTSNNALAEGGRHLGPTEWVETHQSGFSGQYGFVVGNKTREEKQSFRFCDRKEIKIQKENGGFTTLLPAINLLNTSLNFTWFLLLN